MWFLHTTKRKYLGWEFVVYKEEVFRLGVGWFGDVRIWHIPQEVPSGEGWGEGYFL